MSEDYFNERLEDALEQAKYTLGVKAKEYVRDNDRMHNFNCGAVRTGKSREQIIADFRLKHEVSLDDLRNDIDKGILPPKNLVEEKFGDIINYFLLEKISILHKIDSTEENQENLS